jgi:16S rRNA (cytidine1402-2'-O)-methyltransferase
MPVLYVIGTPIGNLEDITLRALRVLKEVSLIAAEDTRKTMRLLNHYKIITPLTSFYEHSCQVKTDYLLGRLGTEDVALVSEAGMPGISDPGYELIAAAAGRGITVIVIPGPSAVVTALAAAGLPSDRFFFLGFMPRKSGDRRRVLLAAAREKSTLVLYEAPHRLKETFRDIISVLGNRRCAVCRELTKLHEEVFRGTLEAAESHFSQPRGEFTLVIEGYRGSVEPVSLEQASGMVAELRHSGMAAREALGILIEQTGLSRRELYRIWLKTE